MLILLLRGVQRLYGMFLFQLPFFSGVINVIADFVELKRVLISCDSDQQLMALASPTYNVRQVLLSEVSG